MARLDGVVEMLRERGRPAPTPQQFMETQTSNQYAAPENMYLQRMISMMERSQITPDDVREGMIMIAAGLSSLDGQMQELSASVDRRVDSLDPAIQAIQEVAMKLDALIKVISDIQIPEPPAPQVSIDMSRVESALASIQSVLDEFEPVSQEKEEKEEPKPKKGKKWKFNVKRGQGGYIKSIDAEEDDED